LAQPPPFPPTAQRCPRILSVARVTEISATSTASFEDAIRQGLERATKTLRGVTAAWIKDQRVKLEGNRIAEYQVNMEVTFVLEG
jgi:flavin-binding protein dodecin